MSVGPQPPNIFLFKLSHDSCSAMAYVFHISKLFYLGFCFSFW